MNTNDTSIPCSVAGCTKSATVTTYILKPYYGNTPVIDAIREPDYPHLCATHVAKNHLGPPFTTAPVWGGVQVYSALTDDPLTKELLKHLPKAPEYPSRGGFAAYQRRAWKVFRAGDDNEFFRLKLRCGKLKKLVEQLELELPDWCNTEDCPGDAKLRASTGERVCSVCASRKRQVDATITFQKLPGVKLLPEERERLVEPKPCS